MAEPRRFMAEYCLRKYNGVRRKQCQEIMKIHQKIGPKIQKSIKMSKNDPRPEKVAPRIGNGAEKGQGVPNKMALQSGPNQPKWEKKGSQKSTFFSTLSWNRLFLILGFPRHPKSNQNELKIDPGTAKAHFWRGCIFYRPCHGKTYFLTP